MIYYRVYPSYSDYVFEQGTKARKGNIHPASIPSRTQGFAYRFRRYYTKHMLPGRVLCLGARTGCEVKGFIQCGFAGSIGVDLYPLGRLVVKGDWHNLPFESGLFENVYTNSIDHCLDFNKMVTEASRVLKSNGRFIFETWIHYALDSRLEGESIDVELVRTGKVNKHPLNAMFWDSISDVTNVLLTYGFEVIHSFIAEPKWCGFVLKRS